jgi:cyclase
MHVHTRYLAIALAVFVWLGTAHAQSLGFAAKSIGPNVWAAITDEKGTAGGNAGIVVGEDGVLVVDTFVSVEAAQQLLGEIRKLTKLPIKYVVNTHYHFDHVGGNRVFADAGATVVSHENVPRWIVPENLAKLGPTPKPELKAMIEAATLPTTVFQEGVDLDLGTRKVEVRFFPGHTGGDAVVSIPDAKVVFGGDLLWRNFVPNLVDATTSLWIETLNALSTQRDDWTFVPGHGDLATARDVVSFRDYLSTVRTLVNDAQRQGRSGDGVVDLVMPALKQKYGQMAYFEYLARLNILETDAELKGTKRVPK